MKNLKNCNQESCLARRRFIQSSAFGVTSMLLADLFPGRVLGQDDQQRVQVTSFPRVAIGKLSELKQDQPVDFSYPQEATHTECILVKLGQKAGGGVGDNQDIVAFSSRCTHMGGDMSDGYVAEHKVIGCGEHLSTFDLTRHGIMVAGHATETLPQIVLEIDDNTIWATAISGLLFGYHQNPIAETK